MLFLLWSQLSVALTLPPRVKNTGSVSRLSGRVALFYTNIPPFVSGGLMESARESPELSDKGATISEMAYRCFSLL